MKDLIVYFGSCGCGENLQATPVLRALAKHRRIVLVVRSPVDVLIPKAHVESVVVYDNNDPWDGIAQLRDRLNGLDHPVPWTSHLTPNEQMRATLTDEGLIAEPPNRIIFDEPPLSASRMFMIRVMKSIGQPPADDVRMEIVQPPEPHKELYDVLVSVGSAERMRRLPEHIAVEICNRLHRRGKKVLFHSHGGRPNNLHSSVNYARNSWNEATLLQLNHLIHASRCVVTPDSGAVHMALAHGRRLVFLESREHAWQVIDPIYWQQVTIIRADHPPCMMDCAARRKELEKWPVSPCKACEPNYPFNMDCSNEQDVPCLKLNEREIKAVLDAV